GPPWTAGRRTPPSATAAPRWPGRESRPSLSAQGRCRLEQPSAAVAGTRVPALVERRDLAAALLQLIRPLPGRESRPSLSDVELLAGFEEAGVPLPGRESRPPLSGRPPRPLPGQQRW